MLSKKFLFIAIFISGIAMINISYAKDLYVDINSIGGACSDAYTNTTNSITQPFCTIQKAVDVVTSADDIIVRNGIYTDNDYDRYIVSINNKNGTPDNWITIKSENQYGAVLDGQLTDWNRITNWTYTGSNNIYWAPVNYEVTYISHGSSTGSTADVGHRKTNLSELLVDHDFYYDISAQKLYYRRFGINNWYIAAHNGAGYGIIMSNSSYIRFEGFEFKRLIGNAFYIGSGSNIYMYGNKLHDFTRVIIPCDYPGRSYGFGSGVYTSLGVDYLTYDSNLFYNIGRLKNSTFCIHDHNKDHAIYSNANYLNIINNIFYDENGPQYTITSAPHDVNILNNTFYIKVISPSPSYNQINHIQVESGARNYLIANNIFYMPDNQPASEGPIVMYNWDNGAKASAATVKIYNNLIYGNGVNTPVSYWQSDSYGHDWSGLNNIFNQDPRFIYFDKTDFASQNLQLISSSPAINAGYDISSYFNIVKDFISAIRPVGSIYDLGVYEYQGSVVPPPADTTPPSPPQNLRIIADTIISNIIINPGFESGVSSWSYYSNGTSTFKADAPGNNTPISGHINIINPGTNVQLYQYNLPLEANKSYTLSFQAKSKNGGNLDAKIIKHVSNYDSYGFLQTNIDLTPNWSTYSYTFTTAGFTGTITDARLMFWLAPYDTIGEEYFFDEIFLTKLN